LFYACHNKYLGGDERSTYDRPEYLKSRDAVTNLRKAERIEKQKLGGFTTVKSPTSPIHRHRSFHVHFSKKKEKEERKTFKDVAKLIVNVLAFEKEAMISRKEDWSREEYGGLKMWVHRTTGEVATEDPFRDNSLKFNPATKLYPSKDKLLQEHKRARRSLLLSRCGSAQDILYDHAEMEELFRNLDKMPLEWILENC
jgi:hypothetical protein